MPQQVCHGALLSCSMGLAPSQLVVLPINRVLTGNAPAANLGDNKPLVNIQPFGMCRSPANPSVAAATAAAMGVLTPMPCVPNTPAPWIPGAATVFVGNQPALDSNCRLLCAWAGVISVSFPGQLTHEIP